MPRGEATPDDLARRRAADRLLRAKPRPKRSPAELSEVRRAARAQRPGTVRWPQPRQKPNGRWLAKATTSGHLHTRTFDTREAAEQFIREVKGTQ